MGVGPETLIVTSFFTLLLQFVEICRGAPIARTTPATAYTNHKFKWACRSTGCEHVLHYATAGCGEPVLLLHGFGGNVDYWRATIPAIAADGFKVYALDMLGFGASDKPADAPYSIDLWSELALDFLNEFAEKPAIIVGNSLGSLVALNAAAANSDDPRAAVKALVLLNCAGGMNSKFVLTDNDRPAWQRAIFVPVFAFIDWVLTTPALRDRAFAAYSSAETVRSILQSVYVNKERVDDELVRAILAPAADPTAPEVFAAILAGDPGISPASIVDKVRLPILAVWGDRDSFTPLDGPTGRLFSQLAQERPESVAMRIIKAGHVPHDDDPPAALDAILPFIRTHLPKVTTVGSAR